MAAWLLLVLALLAMLFAGAMWYSYVRPAPEISDSGTITSKTFIPARTIEHYQGGARSESFSRQKITMPDSYLFGIQVQGSGETVLISIAAPAAAQFEVGQNVHVRYAERGIPLLSRRIQVLEMTPSSTVGPKQSPS